MGRRTIIYQAGPLTQAAATLMALRSCYELSEEQEISWRSRVVLLTDFETFEGADLKPLTDLMVADYHPEAIMSTAMMVYNPGSVPSAFGRTAAFHEMAPRLARELHGCVSTLPADIRLTISLRLICTLSVRRLSSLVLEGRLTKTDGSMRWPPFGLAVEAHPTEGVLFMRPEPVGGLDSSSRLIWEAWRTVVSDRRVELSEILDV
jgi:hypothetical protein